MYKKTIVLHDVDIARVISGNIKIQKGQWIRLAFSKEPSRFVGTTKSTIWASHCYTDNKGKNRMSGGIKKFSKMCKTISTIQATF